MDVKSKTCVISGSRLLLPSCIAARHSFFAFVSHFFGAHAGGGKQQWSPCGSLSLQTADWLSKVLWRFPPSRLRWRMATGVAPVGGALNQPWPGPPLLRCACTCHGCWWQQGWACAPSNCQWGWEWRQPRLPLSCLSSRQWPHKCPMPTAPLAGGTQPAPQVAAGPAAAS